MKYLDTDLSVTNRIRNLCRNTGARYTRRIAAEQLKKIGLVLAPDFYPRPRRPAKKIRPRV